MRHLRMTTLMLDLPVCYSEGLIERHLDGIGYRYFMRLIYARNATSVKLQTYGPSRPRLQEKCEYRTCSHIVMTCFLSIH